MKIQGNPVTNDCSTLTLQTQIIDIPWHSRVMPCADACLCMKKVHLTLLRSPLLCRKISKKKKKLLLEASFGESKKDNILNQKFVDTRKRCIQFCSAANLK